MLKRKLSALLFSLIALISVPYTSHAQLSLMAGGEYAKGTKTGTAPLLGFDGKLAVDIGKRWQVSFNGNQLKPVEWIYLKDVDLGYTRLSTQVPKPLTGAENLKINEFGLTGTYFLLGKNTSTAGVYASLGTGLRMYHSVTSAGPDATEQTVRKATDYFIDSRIGAQVNIAIGWLYVEGRYAPPVSARSMPEGYYPHAFNPYLGMNAGIRFLLNQHPQCPQ